MAIIRQLGVFLFLFSTLMLTTMLAAGSAGAKPNIVFILMDNFGYGELGV